MDIKVANLHFTYPTGVEALRGIELKVPAQSRVAIVGANGSGKTTLVKHFNGLLRPTTGTIHIGDWKTSDYRLSQLARRVGYVFQNPDEQLFKPSVRQELTFGPTNLGFSSEQIQARVDQALELLELKHLAEEHPADCSFPWRKRIAFASVVSMDTPIIVLDEPTTGQDARSVRLFGHVVDTLHQAGKTVIAISHDIEFVADHFDRVVVMYQGQVLLDGTPAEVFQQEDLLERSLVHPPQLARLAHRLQLGQVVTNPEDFIEALANEQTAQRGKD
ncbi:ABC transporter ATP-binding protein [Ktedonosporobacter rubrisoli]|uniref:ABC transporter ATP-binding protein n=1 Tax=Ktedonosporobacter rubrisoli TaxID=2509675 RepID=A0A4V0YYW1_KTERU|nr:ABC transporter ATP-binding protein [Ktedonosporobacter rubrisoli]QBD77601.1 ABC transporter ATP-binding protein [Ktedonosporobacter rubrisoli]